MAKRKTRKIVKRSTRRGAVRKTARRAYVPKRRARSRARSNPKGLMSTPAFRYGAWAAGGAAAEVVLNQTGFLATTIKNRAYRSAAYAALAVFAGRMLLKGRAKENAIAMGVGMLIPGISSYVGAMDLGSKFNMGTTAIAPPASSTRVAKMTTNPFAVASRHATRASGLTAIK